MSAQLLEKLQVPPDDPLDQPRFNSLTPEKLAELESAFANSQDHKMRRAAGVSAGALAIGGYIMGLRYLLC